MPQRIIQADEPRIRAPDVLPQEISGQCTMQQGRRARRIDHGRQTKLPPQIDFDPRRDAVGVFQSMLPIGFLLLAQIAPSGETEGQAEDKDGQRGDSNGAAASGWQDDLHEYPLKGKGRRGCGLCQVQGRERS